MLGIGFTTPYLVPGPNGEQGWKGELFAPQEAINAGLKKVYDLDVPVLFGVGAAFDIHSGNLSQAPAWMQRNGLEWAYRFLQEPRRMFRRYFVEDMAFFGMFVREWRNARRPGA